MEEGIVPLVDQITGMGILFHADGGHGILKDQSQSKHRLRVNYSFDSKPGLKLLMKANVISATNSQRNNRRIAHS